MYLNHKYPYLNKCIIILLCLFSFANLTFANKNILVLHSYNNGLSWTEGINNGITETFTKAFDTEAELWTEFMDAKRFHSFEYFHDFKVFLSSKYKDVNFDIILCSDNAAFNFLSTYKNELFGNIPVVFCGVNYCDSIPEGFTGIMETIDFKTTFDAITAIHPDYNKIYIINDHSITGNILTNQVIETASRQHTTLRYEFLSDYSLHELQDKLKTLEQNDIILLLLFTQDRNGYTYSFDHILEKLNPYINNPIYGAWDFYLGKGIVGGYILNSNDQGQSAAQIAINILNGAPVDSIIVVSGPSQFMFDNNKIISYNIKKKFLPKESEIINNPLDFIFANKPFFLSLTFFLFFLLVLIISLALQKRQLKNSLANEKQLTQQVELKSKALNKALIKAEESNQLKSRFLSNISHEVRTPLNAILGFSGMLEDAINRPGMLQTYIDIIQKSSNQLLYIIDDILIISIIDSHQVSISKSKTSINKTLKEQVLLPGHSINNNTIILGHFAFKDGEDIIQTDNFKLSQILFKLIHNANKFTENGIIEIGYHYLAESSMIEFYIRDTGIGVDEKNHDLIFERFKQVEQSKSKLYGGNGLGLTISKAYTELMGGTMRIESELNIGATFYFTIPYSPPTEDIKSISDNFREGKLSKKAVILIAEDDDASFIYLQNILQHKSSEIIRATNGELAVHKVKERNDIDIILMDLNMPIMDGYEATSKIKRFNDKVPILAQSAYNSQESIFKAINAGCSDFLTKPIKKDILLKKFDELLS